MAAVDSSYQLLACQYLDEQLKVLMGELLGVRRNDGIEPVHQSRVASRRVRAALSMFANCFTSRKAAQWPKRIKKLTRELGAARDKDVQIEFVEQFLTALDEKDRKHRLGVERLLLRLRQERQALQSEIIEMLDKIEKLGTLAQMFAEMEKSLFVLKSHGTPPSSPFVLESTRTHIRDRTEELMAASQSLEDKEVRWVITRCGSRPRSCATRWRSPIACVAGDWRNSSPRSRGSNPCWGMFMIATFGFRTSTNSCSESGSGRSSTMATTGRSVASSRDCC